MNEALPLIGLIAVIVTTVLLVTIVSVIRRKKRRERFTRWAKARQWVFDDAHDPRVRSEFAFVDKLQGGDRHATSEILRGRYFDRNAISFTHTTKHDSTDDEGNSSTSVRHHSVIALQVGGNCPELKIGKENAFKRMGHAISGRDIDFESSDFSRKFEVISKDRAFAFDVCNPHMIEYLLSQPIEAIEIERSWITITKKGRTDLDRIDPVLEHLHRMRELMPESLFDQAA